MVEEALSYHIMTLGNPLLDISVEVMDDTLLKKYSLKANDTVLAQEHHMPLYAELQTMDKCMFIPGGSGLNSLRTAQTTAYIGAIAQDEIGLKMQKLIEKEEVVPFLQRREKVETGKCAVILYQLNRSLVPFLGAASHCDTEYIDSIWNEVEKAKVFYVAGYFISTNKDSLMKVAKYANDNQKPFIFNLSAPFWIEAFGQDILGIVKYCDYIICNEAECQTFGKLAGYEEKTNEEIMKRMVSENKYNSKVSRVVVVTSGCEPTILCTKDEEEGGHQFLTVPVMPIEKKDIVDTNGAGDAFAGGFIAGIAVGKEYKDCIHMGMKAAKYILKRSGTTFEQDSDIDI